jgi:hypothetical protein
MSLVADVPAARQSLRGPAVLLSLAGLLALAFFGAAAVPYIVNPAFNAAIFGAERPLLLAHITFGTLTLFAGPVQIWLGLNDRRMGVHRRLGVIYMIGVLGGSAAAFAMLRTPAAGWVYGAGLAGLAIAWLTTTGMAFLAIKRHLIQQHKEWMIRSYVVTFGFVIFRVGVVALAALGIGSELEQAEVMSWAAWSLPLVANELILQGRKILAVPAI